MSSIVTRKLPTLAAIALAGAIGCGNSSDDVAEEQGALGEALPGTNAAAFSAAAANFGLTETQEDGLGPIFNERSCGQCHSNSAMGGAGQQVERRYGKITNGVFDPMANTGGSLRQLFGIGGFQDHDGTNCQSGTDANPPQGATIFAGRLTTPLFGLGLVEAIPDATIQAIAAAQRNTPIAGTVNMATIHLTDSAAGMVRGARRVARFGWKAPIASLTDFAGDAYLNEMGITTTSCAGGQIVNDFATENRANAAGNNNTTGTGANVCDDDKAAGVDDDFAEEENDCAGGLTAVQDDLANFAFFMRNLNQPGRGIDNSNGRGLTEFNREGCNGCHVTTTFNARGRNFQPFSDFLVHDMGTLGDLIGIDGGENAARTRQMRTAPLWGLRFRNLLLHDGRTSDRSAAIRAHSGQGAAAAAAFNAASASQRNDLLLFLSSL